MEYQRQTAYKLSIDMLLSGIYQKGAGENQDYVIVGALPVSRVNIIGIIVSLQADETGYANALLDDGTGSVILRSFGPLTVSVGDLVLAIGRVRDFSDKRYIIPEAIRKLDDPRWAQLRKKELVQIHGASAQQSAATPLPAVAKTDLKQSTSTVPAPAAQTAPTQQVNRATTPNKDLVEEVIVPKSPAEKLLGVIRSLDTGGGAPAEDVLAKIPGGEKIIEKLMQNGDVFEVRPGRYKVLE